jgi:hypothetical protein
MEISDAAARHRMNRALRHDARADGRAAGADHLRDGTVQIGQAHAVDALQRAEESIPVGICVCRRDTGDRPPGDDEHDAEVGKRGHCAPDDLLNCSACDPGGGDRDRRS